MQTVPTGEDTAARALVTFVTGAELTRQAAVALAEKTDDRLVASFANVIYAALDALERHLSDVGDDEAGQ